MSNAVLETWVRQLAQSFRAVATNMLRHKDYEVVGQMNAVSGKFVGAYLPIVSETASIYLGVLSDPEGAERMARAFLGHEPNDALTQDDMADALGEMANMLGGGVQRSIDDAKANTRLGLPIFVSGEVKPGSKVAEAGIVVKTGGIQVTLVVLHGATGRR